MQRIMRDKKFFTLPLAARYVYLCLLAAKEGVTEWRFSDSEFKEFGLTRGTAYRRIKELVMGGFVEKVGEQGSAYVYSFSNRWQA